jgi:hypothetical protein
MSTLYQLNYIVSLLPEESRRLRNRTLYLEKSTERMWGRNVFWHCVCQTNSLLQFQQVKELGFEKSSYMYRCGRETSDYKNVINSNTVFTKL